jgi:hypothetical protein
VQIPHAGTARPPQKFSPNHCRARSGRAVQPVAIPTDTEMRQDGPEACNATTAQVGRVQEARVQPRPHHPPSRPTSLHRRASWRQLGTPLGNPRSAARAPRLPRTQGIARRRGSRSAAMSEAALEVVQPRRPSGRTSVCTTRRRRLSLEATPRHLRASPLLPSTAIRFLEPRTRSGLAPHPEPEIPTLEILYEDNHMPRGVQAGRHARSNRIAPAMRRCSMQCVTTCAAGTASPETCSRLPCTGSTGP